MAKAEDLTIHIGTDPMGMNAVFEDLDKLAKLLKEVQALLDELASRAVEVSLQIK